MSQLLEYAFGFIALEIILLVAFRNRYIPLISVATALIGIEGFLLVMVGYGSLLVRQHLLGYIIVLFFVDVIILLSIWPFISGLSNDESDETEELKLGKNKLGSFSLLAGWLLYPSSIIHSIITSRWFKPILYLLFILLFINYFRSCLETFPDG